MCKGPPMSRTGLLLALSIGTLVGVVFGVVPDLDQAIARFFFDFKSGAPWMEPAIAAAHDFGMWLISVLIACAFATLLIKLALPRARLLISSRAMIFMLVTLGLAPGVMANWALKEHW